ncbi:T9SS type A sorting domain-containing protein [bacterium]|nr:T9SS type A sorting domain-containing protein [bacterium]
MAFHPYVDGIYYLCSNEYTKFGTRIESIWKTEDFGQTWRILYDRRDSYFHRIVVNPEKPNIILVATNEGILRTTDGGQEWNFVDNSVFKALSFTDILVDPLEPQTYYCSSKSMSGPNAHKKNGERAGGVYKSTDYGSTWVGMKTDGMHSVSVNYLYYHENPRRLYAGTSAGLYEYLLGKPSGTDGDNKVHTPASPEWTASPNPVRSGENIVIELFGGTADVAMLKLYDATGKYMKTVYAGEIMNTMTISDNTSSYAPGVYFYRLTSKCCHEIRKIVIVE